LVPSGHTAPFSPLVAPTQGEGRRKGVAGAVLVSLLLLLPACGSNSQNQILVSAAASLTDAFAELEVAFEADNSTVDVILNFAGSSTLREQILEGAPIDVFASANIANMDQVVAAGLTVGTPMVFTGNQLQIAVPQGNPAGVGGLADFASEELLIGLCAEAVPCGVLGRAALDAAGVDPAIDTNEPDVRSLLTKVEAGELDAALVYTTDVASTAGVDGVVIPQAVIADYSIAVLTDAPNPSGADEFFDFVLSPQGQRILVEHGFVAP
jgi:molybdate transport system substrate-binding protein